MLIKIKLGSNFIIIETLLDRRCKLFSCLNFPELGRVLLTQCFMVPRFTSFLFYDLYSMNKTKLECWVLGRFEELYTQFPAGIIEKSESPDFLVHSGGKVIGIELCEIFQDSNMDNGSKLKEREILEGKFGETLLKLLVSKLRDKISFMLSIEFNQKNPFTVRQINSLANLCWVDCMEFLWNNDTGDIRIENDGNNLPKEVNSIFILLSKLEFEPIYCNPQGGWIDNLRNEHVEPILNKHERALKKYKECDEYWLIIREGNYFAGSFSDIKLNIKTPIISDFDKVFIVRTRASTKERIIILK